MVDEVRASEAGSSADGMSGGPSATDRRDSGLIAAFLRGDASAMDRLAAIYLPQVARYSYVIVHDEELAADAAQETFLRVIQSAGRFDTSRSFKPWLFTLARRSCIDLQRHAARRAAALAAGTEIAGTYAAGFTTESAPDGTDLAVVVAIDPTEDVRSRLIAREQQQRALGLMQDLDEEARTILTLRLFDDFTFPDIARMLGRPLSTITTIYYRRLAKLRARMEALEDEELRRSGTVDGREEARNSGCSAQSRPA